MLIFIVFEPFLDFMGGGTSHEMLIFLCKTFLFGCISVAPGDSEAWRPGKGMGSFLQGYLPP